ncbi:hypothetical protein [Staphylococcus massiliensis]|uniref:Uncharacterized protein n=1 Tax=Staphylococcus massiliensis S46 TaxID=1229783 RepID=K9ALH3_9STAP|nr:hypothetical protein [Staphylococcus massiliensis]EKU48223.1 hypothetical protein C273_05937 [Staphylococcus massiliensis S46]MCG3399515.1 hypothetical protein [Staphylococcus massiliensis]MCG3402024.1 hypothetical protein [Staphylococcus massiliensis]MCG3412747.1 hypothetical protein [Staphylococcus massiliensis]POA00124.1 hypothetical protein CD133_05060 [Staphylococcus massiliensis CCUG 55927]
MLKRLAGLVPWNILNGGVSVFETITDFYNRYVYRSKSKKLTYISIALSAINALTTFFFAFNVKRNYKRFFRLLRVGGSAYSIYKRIKKHKS